MSINSLDDGLEGKWVILLNEHIIDSGENIKELVERAKKLYPDKKLTLAKVPTKESMIY
ncbi:MAG: hypothetical protein KKF50_05600 [Nanoarchaeota archaeon]|nr:hypothetical protein [Nanoarchaeota archaeon]